MILGHPSSVNPLHEIFTLLETADETTTEIKDLERKIIHPAPCVPVHGSFTCRLDLCPIFAPGVWRGTNFKSHEARSRLKWFKMQ